MISPRDRPTPLPCAVATAFALAATAATAAPPVAWTAIETPHFRVYSGAGRQVGADLARDLEMLHGALAQLAGEGPGLPGTTVYVFPDDDSLQPFKPALADGEPGSGRAVAGGFFAAREFGAYVAINARTSRSATETIQHEYLHSFARAHLPPLPFWFSEGLAEYYSTFEVRGGSGRVGLPVTSNLHLLMANPGRTLSRGALQRLASVRSSRDLYDNAEDAALVYAQSWAVVHFLLSDDELADRTLSFMRRLELGSGPEAAFEESFGAPLHDLADGVRQHLRAGTFPTFSIDIPLPPRPRPGLMSDAELDIALGDLAIQVGRTALCDRLLEVGLQRLSSLQPWEARPLEVRARIAMAQRALLVDDFTGALTAAGDALFLDPGNALAALLAARAHLVSARDLGGRDLTRELEEARRLLAISLEADRDFVPALVSLGESRVRDPRTPAEPDTAQRAAEGLHRALRLAPTRVDAATLLVRLHALRGELDDAVAVLRRERPRYLDADAWREEWRRAAMVEIQLLRHGLDRLVESTPDRSSLDAIALRLDAVDELAGTTPWLDGFHRPVDELRVLWRVEDAGERIRHAERLRRAGDPVAAEALLWSVLDDLEAEPGGGRRADGLVRDAESLLRRLAPGASPER